MDYESSHTGAEIDSGIDNIASHTANKSNPHEVTKEQVGLGNCDNTSDADKPISDATQTALDAKVPATRTVATIDLADDITVDELFGALKSKFVDMLYPIGARYVQLAGMPEPSTFGGTWSVDSDYNGKTLWCSTSDELGTALTEELPNIKGWESSSALYGANAHLGAIQEQWKQSHRYTESGGTNIGQGGYTFNAALGQVNADGSTYKAEADSTYKDGGVVRPASMTCKVWKRTA